MAHHRELMVVAVAKSGVLAAAWTAFRTGGDSDHSTGVAGAGPIRHPKSGGDLPQVWEDA